MADTVSQYVAANDNAQEFLHDATEKLQQSALEDIDALVRNTEERDEELWNALGVDPELVIDDYDEVDADLRNLDWVEGMGGMSAAATSQVFLDNRDSTIIRPLAYREQVLGGFALTRTQLVKAAKRQVVVVARPSFEALQTRYVRELADLRRLTNIELYTALNESGAMRSADKLIADQMQYVSRMTSYRPGSTQFREAVADLVDVNSRDRMASMNKRAVQQLYTERETGGDVNAEMVWILEPGSKTCPYCKSRAGEILPYSDWVTEGLPGADVCAGGDRCNCHLAAV